ncbi:MAG: hypothetical protein LIO60_07630 [Oscillospiraceae bacterium]|nr:hypothetical protein [Oscillospiraceae bacterium]
MAAAWLGMLFWFTSRSDAEVPEEVVSALEAEEACKTAEKEALLPAEEADGESNAALESGLMIATDEQCEAIYEGTATAEEIKAELGITAALKQTGVQSAAAESEPAATGTETGTAGATATGSEAATTEPTAAELLLTDCKAELSALQIDLMAQLAVMKQEVLDEWYALSAEEQTDTKKKELFFAGLDQYSALETVVDEEVQAVLDRYEAELQALGADISPIDALWDYYVAEKIRQENYYLSYLN